MIHFYFNGVTIRTSLVYLQQILYSSLRLWNQQKTLLHEPQTTQTLLFHHESSSLIIMWHHARTGITQKVQIT